MRALLAFAALALPAASPPAANLHRCVAIADLVSPALFARYPVDALRPELWRDPDLRAGKAHLYRTVLRAEGRGPPDFAGRYKVVRLGCGAGTVCPVFVDRASGRIVEVPALASISGTIRVPEAPGIDDPRLVHHRGSRLLVAAGTRNENDRLTGVSLFDWQGGRATLIRFVPSSRLCGGDGR